MMYKLIKQGHVYQSPIKKFTCNTFEEALQITEDIPFGSVLYVVKTYTYYIYNSLQQWIPQGRSVDYV